VARGGWEELYSSGQLVHQKRGEGYHPTMISHGVEIAIARGVGVMVPEYLLVGFGFFPFFSFDFFISCITC